eukprot:5198575-Prymnesium_polylepis.1
MEVSAGPEVACELSSLRGACLCKGRAGRLSGPSAVLERLAAACARGRRRDDTPEGGVQLAYHRLDHRLGEAAVPLQQLLAVAARYDVHHDRDLIQALVEGAPSDEAR